MKVLRINQIKLSVQHTKADLDRAVCRVLQKKQVPDYRIIRQSIDARDKEKLRYIYTIEVPANLYRPTEQKRYLKDKNITIQEEQPYRFERAVEQLQEADRKKGLKEPPVIVGSGPAGLYCGYELAKAGYQPIIIERGMAVEERRKEIQSYWDGKPLNPDCNVQFGEGGAGTCSDGKLNTMIKDKTGRIHHVLHTFADFGAPSDILYVHKPHIGTDVLEAVVQSMRKKIIELGGQVWFQTCLTDIETEGTGAARKLTGIWVKQGEQVKKLSCECLVLAIGHSARDTFYLLEQKGVYMTPKAFAVGLRIEHPASMIQEAQYGRSREAQELPAADYKLTHQTPEGRAVYSFCMCPGGHIVDASSEPGRIAVNGMSYRSRDAQNSNSAIVVNVTPEDFPGSGSLAGIEFQRTWEAAAYKAGQGKVPLQLFGDYCRGTASTSLGEIQPDLKGQYALADLNGCLPNFVNNAIINGIMSFDKRIHGFAREDAILCGIESRTSSPVRIQRDSDLCSNIAGIYPCGEGAGYAGGITSAAVDGIRVAEAVAAQLSPEYR